MRSNKSSQRGVLLLEALVSILLTAFGILGLVALWAVSVKGVSEAKYRSDAGFLANEMIGQMWLNRAAINTSYTAPSNWTARVAATLPQGTGTVAVAADPDDATQLITTVTVRWQLPGDAQHNFVSIARINGAGAL